MRAHLRIAIVALVVLLALVTPALGQAFGRVVFVVKDADGNPVPDVKVTVTSPERDGYSEEGVTNKKGRVTIGFADATLLYDVKVEHPDYPTGNLQVKPEVRGTIEREITVASHAVGASTNPDNEGGGAVVFTPTERTFNAGVEALRADDVATAEAKFREATTMKADYAPAWSALAGVLLRLERYDEALVAAQRTVELEPESARSLRLLYDALKGVGNDSEAKKVLDKLSELDRGGDTAAMLYNEAVAALKVGDNEAAKPLLRQALEVQPDLRPALSALALSHILDEEWVEAAATADRVLALEPENRQALRIRYDAYTRLGDTAKAEAALADLVKVDPTAAVGGFLEAGETAFQGGQMQEAAANFERVVQLQPDNARAHYKLGLAYVNLEDTAKAKQHLERFVALAPEDPEAQTARDMLSYLQ